MRKWMLLFLTAVFCMNFSACGNKVEDMVVNGDKVAVTDYLIEHLGKYISTEEFAAREAQFTTMYEGADAVPFTVTRVIELEAEGIGENQMSIHYLLVKADWTWAVEEHGGFSNILLVVNYDTCEVLDEFMVDESSLNDPNSVEYMNYVMLHGPLVGEGYDGGTIIVDSEKRTELAKKDIDKVNEALRK